MQPSGARAITDLDALTDAILHRCDLLAECSEEPGRLTRTFLRPPMERVHELLTGWMQGAHLVVRRDAVGNLIGRRGDGAKVFAVGSHVDTVPNAGKYDGPLGVLLGIAAAQALKAKSSRTLDVIAFSEEEGVRFRSPYLGSLAVVGHFLPGLLTLQDVDGVSVEQAIRGFGLDTSSIPQAAYADGQLLGYLEAHIEQGPVLEAKSLGLGVVSAIAGQSRFSLRFLGQSGHAGTQPMELRKDALVSAAEFVGFVNRTARSNEGLRATVGRFVALPGAVNVIPGEVQLSLDVRHAVDSVRHAAVTALLDHAASLCKLHGTAFVAVPDLNEPAVPCDAGLMKRLSATLWEAGHPPCDLISGAGHDAVVLARRCPVAMLFLRSPGGLSHHPDEAVLREDVRAALEVMIRFLQCELERA